MSDVVMFMSSILVNCIQKFCFKKNFMLINPSFWSFVATLAWMDGQTTTGRKMLHYMCKLNWHANSKLYSTIIMLISKAADLKG